MLTIVTRFLPHFKLELQSGAQIKFSPIWDDKRMKFMNDKINDMIQLNN